MQFLMIFIISFAGKVSSLAKKQNLERKCQNEIVQNPRKYSSFLKEQRKFKDSSYGTKIGSQILCIMVTALVILVNISSLWLLVTEIDPNADAVVCHISKRYGEFYYFWWKYIKFLITDGIPLLLIIVTSIKTLVQLRNTLKENSYSVNSTTEVCQPSSVSAPLDSCSALRCSNKHKISSTSLTFPSVAARKEKNFEIEVMPPNFDQSIQDMDKKMPPIRKVKEIGYIIAVPCLGLLISIPRIAWATLVIVDNYYQVKNISPVSGNRGFITLCALAFKNIIYLSHSLTFFVFLIASSKFRKAIKRSIWSILFRFHFYGKGKSLQKSIKSDFPHFDDFPGSRRKISSNENSNIELFELQSIQENSIFSKEAASFRLENSFVLSRTDSILFNNSAGEKNVEQSFVNLERNQFFINQNPIETPGQNGNHTSQLQTSAIVTKQCYNISERNSEIAVNNEDIR